jgi:hypothetical protein
MLLHSDSKSEAVTMLLALLPAVSSIAVAPATFMNYNWATSVESRKVFVYETLSYWCMRPEATSV